MKSGDMRKATLKPLQGKVALAGTARAISKSSGVANVKVGTWEAA